eukprot:gene15138-biopygen4170
MRKIENSHHDLGGSQLEFVNVVANKSLVPGGAKESPTTGRQFLSPPRKQQKEHGESHISFVALGIDGEIRKFPQRNIEWTHIGHRHFIWKFGRKLLV